MPVTPVRKRPLLPTQKTDADAIRMEFDNMSADEQLAMLIEAMEAKRVKARRVAPNTADHQNPSRRRDEFVSPAGTRTPSIDSSARDAQIGDQVPTFKINTPSAKSEPVMMASVSILRRITWRNFSSR